MQVQNIQDNNTNFKAQLIVNGQKLPKRFNKRVAKMVSEIGSNTDTIAINMGHQYDKQNFRTPGNGDNYHIVTFSKYYRDIAIDSVINGEVLHHEKTLEVFPNTNDAIQNVKEDIINYLEALKNFSKL